jgi:hypothetical protein
MLSHRNIISYFMACKAIMPFGDEGKALVTCRCAMVYERMLTYLYQYCGDPSIMPKILRPSPTTCGNQARYNLDSSPSAGEDIRQDHVDWTETQGCEAMDLFLGRTSGIEI